MKNVQPVFIGQLKSYLPKTVDLVIFVRFNFLRISQERQIREFKNLKKIITKSAKYHRNR